MLFHYSLGEKGKQNPTPFIERGDYMRRVYLDFETRSPVDIQATNASVYARHPETKVLCGVLRKDGNDLQVLNFADPEARKAVLDYIEGCLIVAHNAQFEILIWKHILHERMGYPMPPISQFRCTKAKLAAHALPLSLEKGAETLNLLQKKDMAGYKHMLVMCKPEGPNDYDSMIKLVQYCGQDNVATQCIDNTLPDLTEYEQKIWEFDQEINLRGVRIDDGLVDNISSLLTLEKENLLKEFKEITNGAINTPDQREVFRLWVESNGVPMKNVQAKTVKTLLADKTIPTNVRRVLEIRQILSKKSTAKYETLKNTIDDDGRLRCNLIYHGASTGRWTGSGAQLQNLPRPKFDVTGAIDYSNKLAGLKMALMYGSAHDAASSMLRSVIIPSEGKALIGVDLAGIEARVLPWCAGQLDVLNDFAEGKDPYLTQASSIFGREITKGDKDERQVGKGSGLGCQYQGGINALFNTCQMFGISLFAAVPVIWPTATPNEKEKAEYAYRVYAKRFEDPDAEGFDREEGLVADIIKQRWRKKNTKIVAFWDEINNCAITAVLNPGVEYSIRRVYEGVDVYICSWRVEDQFLYCTLPNWRRLAYYKPKVETKGNRQTLSYVGMDSKTKQMLRRDTYGGHLTENLVQAISRDIMVSGMANIENAGHDIILTVHDESVQEVEIGTDPKELESLMTAPIDWAVGLPLGAEAWYGFRYQK